MRPLGAAWRRSAGPNPKRLEVVIVESALRATMESVSSLVATPQSKYMIAPTSDCVNPPNLDGSTQYRGVCAPRALEAAGPCGFAHNMSESGRRNGRGRRYQ